MPLEIGFHQKTNEPITLPRNALKRHIVALGSSGSGKTVMGKAIIEECVREEIPVIVIDIQGDLASLALLGDKNSVTEKGTPERIYEDYKKKAAVAIFTPASRKGIPISINPLKAPPEGIDEEDRILSIDATASSVLPFLGYDEDTDAGSLVKDYLFVLLQRIWEKNEEINGFGDLAQAITNDANYLQPGEENLLTEKEKEKLARKVRGLTVGADALLFNLGISLDVENLISWAPKGKVPVNILYLNTLHRDRDKQSFIAVIAQETYRWMLKNPSRKVQLIFFIDELAGLVPPHPYNPPTKKYIQLLMKQARKYGVSMMLATQNISDVDYKSLSQVATWFLGRMMTQQDLAKVRQIIESISPSEADSIIAQLPKLTVGKFMLLSPDNYDEVQPIRVRWLVTDHRTLDDTQVKEIMDQSGYRSLFTKMEETAEEEAKIKGIVESSAIIEEEEEEKPPEETKKIEKGNLNQIISQLQTKPEALSAEEIAELSGVSKSQANKELKALVDSGKLVKGKYKGKTVFYNPETGIDPEKFIVGAVYRFPLKFPIAKAKKRIRDGMMKTLGVVQERVVGQPRLYYVPFWRVPVFRWVKKGGLLGFVGRKEVKERFYVYVNALTGEIFVPDSGQLKSINMLEEINLNKLDLPSKGSIRFEKLVPGTLRGQDLLPKMAREDAAEQVRMVIGADLAEDENPALVYMPLWEFLVEDKQIPDNKRYLWLDGYLGTIYNEDITAQARLVATD